jgi:hypothetical protein
MPKLVGVAFVANRSLVFFFFFIALLFLSSSSSILFAGSRGIFPPLDHSGDSRGRRSSRLDRIVQ